MSLSSELALDSARTFGGWLTLENGVYTVAGFNVVAHTIGLFIFLAIAGAGLFNEGEFGCFGTSGECLRIPPGEAVMMGGFGTLFTVPLIYLNVRLYSAVQEKDDEFVYLWLKISSGFTVIKALGYPSYAYLVPDLLELWLVHAYQQSQEIAKLKGKLLPMGPKP